MQSAIAEAKKAAEKDEVPVGAVIAKDGEIIAACHNSVESGGCTLNHAEMSAIREAQAKLGKYLDGCEIFVTLEPCAMCMGAIIGSHIGRVYFGAFDRKGGCAGTVYDFTEGKLMAYKPVVIGGVMEKECAEILTEYFNEKRETRNIKR